MKSRPESRPAVRWLQRLSAVPLGVLLFAEACGSDSGPPDDLVRTEERSAELAQTCTATNVSGNPYRGKLCGGAFIDNCTPGLIYSCTGGPRGTTGNCTLSQSCSVGCLTGPGDTPVSANIGTATPIASDACFTGQAPLRFSTNATTGGSYVTMTATLAQAHSPYAVVNFQGTTEDVPPLCNPPLFLFPNATSVSWIEPTNVVASTKNVPLWALIAFNDSSGASRALVSVARPLTLNPGGTLPKPPLLSFSVTDASGNPISTITGGSNAFRRPLEQQLGERAADDKSLARCPARNPAPVGGIAPGVEPLLRQGVTVKPAVFVVPLKVAVMVTWVLAVTWVVGMLTTPLCDPEATVTLAGTDATAGLLLDSETVESAGAPADSTTAPWAVEPPARVEGLTTRFVRMGPELGVTVRVTVLVLPP